MLIYRSLNIITITYIYLGITRQLSLLKSSLISNSEARTFYFKGTDHAGTFMSLKCVVYYANCRIWHQSSKLQVVP